MSVAMREASSSPGAACVDVARLALFGRVKGRFDGKRRPGEVAWSAAAVARKGRASRSKTAQARLLPDSHTRTISE